MLLECSKTEFENHIDFAFELALDLTKSGYPTYRDGIKTKAMFVERLLRAFEREDEQMLLFIHDGAVQGLIHYYWIADDRYLQTNAFCIKEATEQALSEFLSFLGERFKGYDVFLGFPAENQKAVDYLSRRGFECIEDDFNNTACLDRCGQMPESSEIIQITRENYDSFRVLHDQIEGDMYWNSDRICEDLDNWIILVNQREGKPQGAVYYTGADDGWYEIFGIDTDRDKHDPLLFEELLHAAIADTKRRGGRFLTFFCDKEYEETALGCGFVCVGNYLCYKIHLN
ncbi:MAG: hypothetical protein K6G29_12160 [Clostridiales bacterium]|nr:hypothetical protein [Clostridiales bacterium]